MSPCALTIGGVTAELRASGAMWATEAGVLVVADLHLEKGSAYARRGQMLPPWDTRETLSRLSGEIAATSPKTVILLGDTLHDIEAVERIDEADARMLGEIAARTRLIWITGNHDHEGPQGLPGEAAADYRVGGLVFRHEPRRGADHAWAAGHLHPCARVKGRGGTVRRRCFVTDGARIVLPAFGAYAGGLNVRDSAYEGLFSKKPAAVVLGRERAHAVRWAMLAPD
jgi:DNA ligase-associated metallophosphoesterase